MADPDLIARYHYDEFMPEKFGPWLNFGLSTIWSQHALTIVEFGSFT